MAILKKIVWLPYDFDTAIGINNEGQLGFGYSLEDTDTIQGSNVYNGQDSVMWCNLRDAFYSQLSSMYQSLRSLSSGTQFSYEYVEQLFEHHQSFWSASIFNEDAYFKYLSPLYIEGSEDYLEMLQGSKAEQRKWWLYNRFKYLDSKYQSGEARSMVITLRAYAQGSITVTPYADIYSTINWANSYYTRARLLNGASYTHPCQLTTLNDTEIYVYSAPQIKSIGDLSALKVGYCNISYATKMIDLILGSFANGYRNSNCYSVTCGNNTLLKEVNLTKCTGLGDTSQQGHDSTSVDFSGCSNLERLYCGGTNLLSVSLPNGSTMQQLILPSTITSLIVINQYNITNFQMVQLTVVEEIDYFVQVMPPNLTTLWLDNVSGAFDAISILQSMAVGSRIRLYNFTWAMEEEDDICNFKMLLDTMIGLDQSGQNVPTAQVYATITTTNYNQWLIDYVQEKYPEITIEGTMMGKALTYCNWDGTFLHSETVFGGGDGTEAPTPTRPSTAAYDFLFVGWSSTPGGTAEPGILDHITADKIVYAAYLPTVRYYTVLYYTDYTMRTQAGYAQVAYMGDGTTYTDMGGDQTDTPDYTGSGDPDDYEFDGWSEDVTCVVEDMTVYALWEYNPKFTRHYIKNTLENLTNTTITQLGAYALAGNSTLKHLSLSALSFGSNVPKLCFAQVANLESLSLPSTAFNSVVTVEQYAFWYFINGAKIRDVYDQIIPQEFNFPICTTIENMAFSNAGYTELHFPLVTTVGTQAFYFSYVTILDMPSITALGTSNDQRYSYLRVVEEIYWSALTVNISPTGRIGTMCATTLKILDCGFTTRLDAHMRSYTALTDVVFRNTSVVAFSSSDVYSSGVFASSSPIGQGTGHIYVPEDLIVTYQNTTGWSTYSSVFTAIEGSDYEIE